MLGCILPVLVIHYFADINLEAALLISSGSAILVYVIGSAAGTEILGLKQERGKKELILPLVSLAISLVVLPFVGPLSLPQV